VSLDVGNTLTSKCNATEQPPVFAPGDTIRLCAKVQKGAEVAPNAEVTFIAGESRRGGMQRRRKIRHARRVYQLANTAAMILNQSSN